MWGVSGEIIGSSLLIPDEHVRGDAAGWAYVSSIQECASALLASVSP